MRWKWHVAALLAVCGSPPLQAAVVNPSFETGTFAGWAVIGDTTVVSSLGTAAPTHGTKMAYLHTIGGLDGFAVPQPFLEAFLGLAPGTADAAFGADVVEGSIISQTIVNAGAWLLSFDWKFLTDESPGGVPFNDRGFFALVDPFGALAAFATIDTLIPANFTAGTGGWLHQTAFKPAGSFLLDKTGSYTFYVGVLDIDDSAFDSALLIDNFVLSPVPPPPPVVAEPASLSLLGVGVGTLWLGRRRRRKAA